MAEFDTLTALGDIPGTLAYISPERLQGLTATAAADVWAVGVLLWEALAGEHPFWGGDLAETSRRIQHGAPPLEPLRPDLPRHVLEAVASALVVNPQRRPVGRAPRATSCARCRSGAVPGEGGVDSPSPRRVRRERRRSERLLPGALAGLATGWVRPTLPFYPAGWPLGLAALRSRARLRGAARSGWSSRSPPRSSRSRTSRSGLAVVYAARRRRLVALSWRDARAGLLLVAGPLLAPLAALALMPLAAQLARGRARRAAAGRLRRAARRARRRPPPRALPFDGSAPPLGLGIAGSAPAERRRARALGAARRPSGAARRGARPRARGRAPAPTPGAAARGPPRSSARHCSRPPRSLAPAAASSR